MPSLALTVAEVAQIKAKHPDAKIVRVISKPTPSEKYVLILPKGAHIGQEKVVTVGSIPEAGMVVGGYREREITPRTAPPKLVKKRKELVKKRVIKPKPKLKPKPLPVSRPKPSYIVAAEAEIDRREAVAGKRVSRLPPGPPSPDYYKEPVRETRIEPPPEYKVYARPKSMVTLAEEIPFGERFRQKTERARLEKKPIAPLMGTAYFGYKRLGTLWDITYPIRHPIKTVTSIPSIIGDPGQVIKETKRGAEADPLGFAADIVTITKAPSIFFKGIKVVKKSYIKAGAKVVPAEKYIVPTPFAKAPTPKAVLKAFEKDKGEVSIVHTAPTKLRSGEIMVAPGRGPPKLYTSEQLEKAIKEKKVKLTEDPGLYVSPKGKGQPYFFYVGKEVPSKYTISPIKMAKGIKEQVRVPTISEFKAKDARRLPEEVLKGPKYEPVFEFFKKRPKEPVIWITKRRERQITKEIEGVIPVGQQIKEVKPKKFLPRMKGYEEYIKYEEELIPIRRYKIVGDKKISKGIFEPFKKVKKIRKEKKVKEPYYYKRPTRYKPLPAYYKPPKPLGRIKYYAPSKPKYKVPPPPKYKVPPPPKYKVPPPLKYKVPPPLKYKVPPPLKYKVPPPPKYKVPPPPKYKVPPPPPPYKPKLSREFKFKKPKRKVKSRKRGYFYTASVVAREFDIWGKKPKVLTGYEVRPMIKPKKRKRAKAFDWGMKRHRGGLF